MLCMYSRKKAPTDCLFDTVCLRVTCSNCRSTNGRSQGLAQAIFKRYPEANCYHSVSKPGTVQLAEVSRGDRSKPLFICNLFGQIYAGLASGLRDSKDARFALFQKCLRHLEASLTQHAVLSTVRPVVVIFPARVRVCCGDVCWC